MKYRCIHSYRGQYPLELMCRVLEVSRSGYYAWRNRCVSARARENRALLRAIRTVHSQTDRTYGSPRMCEELCARGFRCGRHRVARLMRRYGIRAVAARARRPKRSASERGPLQNHLQRRFNIPRLNAVWGADLTYIRTGEGWLFLAVVLDLASRRVIGWSMSGRADSQLTLQALRMAVEQRRPDADLLHHADGGLHYTCAEYRTALQHWGIRESFSRLGDCWDNAVVESFFHTLKTERVNRRRYRTRTDARRGPVPVPRGLVQSREAALRTRPGVPSRVRSPPLMTVHFSGAGSAYT